MKIQIFIHFLIPVLILVSLLTLSPKHGNHEVDENPNFHSLFDPCFDSSIFANTITKHGNHEVDENPNFHSLFDPCFDSSIFANTITKTW